MRELNLAGLQNEYDRLRAENDMGPAIVEYSSQRSTGGLIRYAHGARSYHIISISMHMPYAEQIITLRHEAAHAFCGHKAGHNAFFWRTAERFGCTRSGAPETEESKRKREARINHDYDCPACGKTLTTKRRLKGIRYHKPCFDKGSRQPLVLFGSYRTPAKYSVDTLRYA